MATLSIDTLKRGDSVRISPNASKYVVDGMKKYLGQVVTVERLREPDDFVAEGYIWNIKDAVMKVVTDNEMAPPSASELSDIAGNSTDESDARPRPNDRSSAH